jgi:hypothetical protein
MQQNDGLSDVDVVYLWVDGSDLDWQEHRKRAFEVWSLQHPGELARYGDTAGRYRDNDELRYNLRALEQFFPTVHHVWIVTDGQRPSWLNADSRATVVDYRTLEGSDGWRVFDSGNIESLIHHIPGLSERFLYLNDDVFFGAPIVESEWFGPSLTIYRQPGLQNIYQSFQPDETATINAGVRSRQWLSQRFSDYAPDDSVLAHSPRPMLRSVTLGYELEAPEVFAEVRRPIFRNWRIPPIVSDLIPRWMVHEGHAEFADADTIYVESGAPTAGDRLDRLVSRFGSVPFFCINDTCDDAPSDDPRLLRVRDTLKQLLPLPSLYEAQLN